MFVPLYRKQFIEFYMADWAEVQAPIKHWFTKVSTAISHTRTHHINVSNGCMRKKKIAMVSSNTLETSVDISHSPYIVLYAQLIEQINFVIISLYLKCNVCNNIVYVLYFRRSLVSTHIIV